MPRFSEQAGHLEALERDLALYRYALGQPDQEALVRALSRRIDGENDAGRKKLEQWLKEVAIDLCPLESHRTLFGNFEFLPCGRVRLYGAAHS